MNDRDETIRKIKTALQRRSGKQWSVTGGRGTAWGWITIDAPPSRRTWGHQLKPGLTQCLTENFEYCDTGEPGGNMSPADQADLAKLLSLESPVHYQGVNVAASGDHYREYTDRAEGRQPAKIAQAYWD